MGQWACQNVIQCKRCMGEIGRELPQQGHCIPYCSNYNAKRILVILKQHSDEILTEMPQQFCFSHYCQEYMANTKCGLHDSPSTNYAQKN